MSQTGTAAIAKPAKGRRKAADLLVDRFGLNPDEMTPQELSSAISGYDMRHRIEALVAGITTKTIRHEYRGDGAATAPGYMVLPRIAATSLFPMRHVRVLLGYTAHEISHQLVTDFDMLEKLLADTTMEARKKQQVKEFWNAVEDYRIEKVVPREYPGFHVVIDDTRDFSARRFCERVDAGLVDEAALSNPYRIGSVALTWVGAALNGYATRAPEAALDRIDPTLRAWVEGWGPEMAAVETCVEARDLAIRMVDELDQMREQGDDGEDDKDQAGGQKQQSGSGSSSSGGSGQNSSQQKDEKGKDDGKSRDDKGATDESDDKPQDGGSDAADNEAGGGDAGGSDGDSEDDDAGQDGDGGDGTPQKSDGPDADGRPDGGGADQGDPSGGSSTGAGSSRPKLSIKQGEEQHAAEQADLEIDELAKAISSMKGTEATDPDVSDTDRIATGGCGDDATRSERVRRGQSAYNALKHEVGGAAARAAGILRRLLQSQSRRTWRGGREEGELDFGRLVPMISGAPDVYRQRHETQAVNTAVLLLLDNSASMRGHPLRMCQESAVVLDMAIQGTRTNVEITGFTGCTTNPVLYRYRAFGQKGQAASASLGNMDQVALGGTPVSTPLLEAWRRLSQQKEPRRIMIVVSDGGADWNDVQSSREAHDFIVRRGCTILGIAIGGDDSMRNWCTNVQSVKSIEDLPVALTNLVKEALR